MGPLPHFSQTCKDVGAAYKYIVYGGKEEFPLGEDVRMISLHKLMQKLVDFA